MQNAVRREEKIYAVSAPLCLPRVVIVVLDGAFRASTGETMTDATTTSSSSAAAGPTTFTSAYSRPGYASDAVALKASRRAGRTKRRRRRLSEDEDEEKKTYARARVDKRRRRSHGRVEHESAFRTRTHTQIGEMLNARL